MGDALDAESNSALSKVQLAAPSTRAGKDAEAEIAPEPQRLYDLAGAR